MYIVAYFVPQKSGQISNPQTPLVSGFGPHEKSHP